MGKKKKHSPKKVDNKGGIAIVAVVYILLLLAMLPVFKKDALHIWQWYVMLLFISIPALPLTRIFKKFYDKGYVFSKMLTLSISAMFLFVLSSFKILRYTTLNCYIVVIFVSFIAYLPAYIKNGRSIIKIVPFRKADLKILLTEETVIVGIIFVMMYIRAFAPEAYGTERFMDYGFMTTIMRTEYFPPEDLWFSGTNLNYYYLGQYFATFLTKLSFVKVEYTYNLMMVTVCALSFISVFSIVSTMMKQRLLDGGKITAKIENIPIISGVVSAVCVCFMGNMHYVIYKFIAPLLVPIFGTSDEGYIGKNYWYPNATRYIGYKPDTSDKTIHEFPIYSFVLNDLHAHVINIIFVLTLMAFVISYAISKKDKSGKIMWSRVINPTVIFVGFFLGLFQGANFWDFPIYFVTSYAIIMFVNMRVHGINLLAFIYSVLQALISLIVSKIVIFSFSRNFEKMMSGIGFVKNRSMLHQLIVLWGLPIVICIVGMVIVANDYKKQHLQEEKKHIKFSEFMREISISDFIAYIVSCCAIGLIIMPEIVFVKDIYGDGYSRSNTMFKLTYQAFIMFGICIGYFVIKMFVVNVSRRRRRTAIVFSILVFGCTLYFFEAVKGGCGHVWDTNYYKGISSLYHLENDPVFGSDKDAVEFINNNIKGKATILEAPGYSYTEYERISSATGMPTLVGWRTHEWLWKNDVESVDKRAEDALTIYTSSDEERVRSLIDKYEIDYIYIGDIEYKKYAEMGISVNTDLLMKMYPVEYMSTSSDGGYTTYILKTK